MYVGVPVHTVYIHTCLYTHPAVEGRPQGGGFHCSGWPSIQSDHTFTLGSSSLRSAGNADTLNISSASPSSPSSPSSTGGGAVERRGSPHQRSATTSRVGATQGPLRGHSGVTQGSLRGHSGVTQGSLTGHSGMCVPLAQRRTHCSATMSRVRATQGPLRGHSGVTQGSLRGHSGATQGPLRGHSGATQGPLRGHSGVGVSLAQRRTHCSAGCGFQPLRLHLSHLWACVSYPWARLTSHLWACVSYPVGAANVSPVGLRFIPRGRG